jgi:ribonuclease HI
MRTYYTDGSASPNPGPGGFAVILDGKAVVLGSEPAGSGVDWRRTTNIRMEGYAILAALKHAAENAPGEQCSIYSDSEFWINVITKWSLTWEKNGWKKKGGEIKNLDIVRDVCPLYRSSNAELVWVRGHNNDPGNELADLWANEARKQRHKTG